MELSTVGYHFNLLGFLVFNIFVIAVEALVFCACIFGDADSPSKIRWTKSHTIAYIVYTIIIHIVCVGGLTRTFSDSTQCTRIETVSNIKFDGKVYTVNNDQYVKYNKVWYDSEIDNSYIVDSRNKHAIWVFGLDKYTTTKELLLCERDYKLFFSSDIKDCSYNNLLTSFVHYKLELDGMEFDENSIEESKDTNENLTVMNDTDTNSNELNELLKQLELTNKSINDLHTSVNNVASRVDKIDAELENQKQSINNLETKDKVQINPVVLLVGFFGFWIMILITISAIMTIRTKSKKDLILAASDAKIREGVMLEDDKS